MLATLITLVVLLWIVSENSEDHSSKPSHALAAYCRSECLHIRSTPRTVSAKVFERREIELAFIDPFNQQGRI